jgi:predicted nucleotidyltransferase component of viral defense system
VDGPLSFDSLRRLVITALFSDDFLFERLVLKGGSALSLVHEVSSRASFDVDFSMSEDFEDLAAVREKAFHALKARFESVGLGPAQK